MDLEPGSETRFIEEPVNGHTAKFFVTKRYKFHLNQQEIGTNTATATK